MNPYAMEDPMMRLMIEQDRMRREAMSPAAYMQAPPNILSGADITPAAAPMPDLPGADKFAQMNTMDKMMQFGGLSLLAGNGKNGKFNPWMLSGLLPMALKKVF